MVEASVANVVSPAVTADDPHTLLDQGIGDTAQIFGFKRFLRGYDEVMLLSQAEIATIPHLMTEALIAEAVFPIAATGQFGRMDGIAFLQMVVRKVKWLQKNSGMLVELAEG